MSELLPCPLCGHLHPKPGHHSKFKCKNTACDKWLELPKGESRLHDFEARRTAKAAKTEAYWNQKAKERSLKTGEDFDTAKKAELARHNANVKKMREEAEFAKFFPQENKPKAPRPQPYTNETKPIVAMSTTSEDDTGAPF